MSEGLTCVDENVDKEFVVVETDAVVDPRAMVVHLQDTLCALPAMVTSFRLFFIREYSLTLKLLQ